MKENWKDIRLQNDCSGFNQNPIPNTGFQLIRASRRTQVFYQVVVDQCAARPNDNDQVSFSLLVKEYPWNQLITLTYLDDSLFPNGARFWQVGLGAGTEPFIVHNNWIIGMNPKIDRFKAANLWFSDLPAFFTGEERYLTVTLPLMDKAEQIQVLKAAISLAVHLDRVLIMPPDSQYLLIGKVKEIVPVIPHAEIFNCSHYAESSPFKGALLVDMARGSHKSACFEEEAGVSACFQSGHQGFITVGERLWVTSTKDLLAKLIPGSPNAAARLIVLTSLESLPETLVSSQTIQAINNLVSAV